MTKMMGISKIIIISGATATGKTDISLDIAEQYDGEIINCDIGQMYSPLSIGTAKPMWNSYRIPHHLFDIISEPKSINVFEYKILVEHCIKKILDRNKIPILVGGSFFYLKSLFFPPISISISHQKELTNSLVPEKNNIHAGHLAHEKTEWWARLHAIDPLRAVAIHRNDFYRLSRALSLWESTQILPSEQKPLFLPLVESTEFIYIEREREDLYDRIEKRTDIMLKNGWIEEVKNLSREWQSFLEIKKIIGYNDIINFMSFPNEISVLRNIIIQKTKQYAKRQTKFWKSLKKDLNLFGNNCVHIKELPMKRV